MTATTRSRAAYSQPTKTSEARTSSRLCKFYQFEVFAEAPDDAPAGYSRLSDFLTEVAEQHPESLRQGRKWLAQELTGKEQSLRTLRLAKGLSQADLAGLMGTSQPHIARIENGTAQIMLDTAERLARALEISLNELAVLLRQHKRVRGG